MIYKNFRDDSDNGSALREKGRDLTQSYDKAPTPTEMSKRQSDNTNNATKKFDYTTVADRLRTVSWSNYSHPTSPFVLSYSLVALVLFAGQVFIKVENNLKHCLSKLIINQGLDLLNISNSIRYHRVTSKIPRYYRILTFLLFVISTKNLLEISFFNYNRVTSDPDVRSSIQSSCSCVDSPLLYQPACHVVTCDPTCIPEKG